MGERQEADDADEERQTAEDMAQAACLVPSLMAAKQEGMAAGLQVLVEWETLETKRPYPLDTIGRGIGRDRDRAGAPPTWGKRKVRVQVAWSADEGGKEQVLEGQWEYRNKVAALATWAAVHWELPASQVVVHGGSWGNEDADRQLSKSMELGRLWGGRTTADEGIYSPPGGRRGTDGRAGNGNGVHPKLDFKKHGNGTHPPICFLFKCVS
jgi:hypothetical protein